MKYLALCAVIIVCGFAGAMFGEFIHRVFGIWAADRRAVKRCRERVRRAKEIDRKCDEVQVMLNEQSDWQRTIIGLVALFACIAWAATFSRGGAGEIAPAAPNLAPRGYYVLRSAETDAAVPDAILKDKNIAGVSLRRNWSSVESSKGVYDWSYFDRELARIHKAGKEAMLHVDADDNGVPAWLMKSVGKYQFLDRNKNHSTFGARVTLPIPWDDDFLFAWTRFILAFGRHYDGHPDVVAVHVGGPNRHGSECSWPPEVKSVKGYSEKVHLETWDTVFSTYREAFPDTCVVLDLAHPIDGEKKLAPALAKLFYDTSSMPAIQHNSLNAGSGNHYDIHKLVSDIGQTGKPVGFQQVGALGGGFDQSIRIAKQARASWIEIYEPDRQRIKGPLK